MKIERVLTRRSYSVEIPTDAFIALLDAEDMWHGVEELAQNDLGTQINNELRAGNTEYNGHYANFIYFNMDVEEDTEEKWQRIAGLIRNQVEAAVQWRKDNPQRKAR